jgi:hypothetical protein
METSRHISTHIDRTSKEVYDFASNPGNLPHWASGLSNSTVASTIAGDLSTLKTLLEG